MLKSAKQNHYTQSQQTCEKFQFAKYIKSGCAAAFQNSPLN